MGITEVEQKQLALDIFTRCISEIYDGSGHTCLYVGASVQRCQFAHDLVSWGYTLELVEPHYDNVTHYVTSHDSPFSRVIEMSIERMSLQPHYYDMVFWWHGPEHLKLSDIPECLKNIEDNLVFHGGLIVLGCPYGQYPQGLAYGNPYEVHQSNLYPEDFLPWGYSVETAGPKDGGNEALIVAWKWMR